MAPKRVVGIKDHDSGPGPLVERRPKLAALIAAVAVQWTKIEGGLAGLFLVFLGREQEAALGMYLESFDRDLRKKLFIAVGRTKLDEDTLTRFQKLLDRIGKKANKRNAIVHGIWIISDDYPDSLLLYDQQDYHKGDYEYKQRTFKSLEDQQNYIKDSWLRSEFWQHDETYFEELIEKLKELEEEIFQFRCDLARALKRSRT